MTGNLEVDEDGGFWDDHDEDIGGRIDDLQDEYPEGFKYDCCGLEGDQEGCETGPHQIAADRKAGVIASAAPDNPPAAKKRRIWE